MRKFLVFNTDTCVGRDEKESSFRRFATRYDRNDAHYLATVTLASISLWLRVLYVDLKLLIMDEPTAALGVKETARVLDLIRSLKKQGLAIILISHRLEIFPRFADRVALSRHGKIVKDAPVRETGYQLTKILS